MFETKKIWEILLNHYNWMMPKEMILKLFFLEDNVNVLFTYH